MGTQGAAVGVAGHHRAAGCLHQVPEAGVGQVGHVGIDLVLLQHADEVPALCRQATVGGLTIGTAQNISPVPHRVEQADAPDSHLRNAAGVTVQQIRPLDGQKRGGFACRHRRVHLRACGTMRHQIGIGGDFTAIAIMKSLAKAPTLSGGDLGGVAVEGEKLGTGRESGIAL